MKLKIMTFNVLNGWHSTNIGVRDDLAASAIFAEAPDVIGFQEFDPSYRAAEKPLPELIAPKYAEIKGDGANGITWNPIFYNVEKLRPVKWGELVYKKGTFHPSYPGVGGGVSMFRTIFHALFEDIQSGTRFIMLNTHYDMNNDKELKIENQIAEVAELDELARALIAEYGTETLFVTGDYNSKIGDIPCREMLERGFTDTYSLAIKKDDSGSCSKLGAPLWGTYEMGAIDHVFFKGGIPLTVNEYFTVNTIRDASDHSPVCVTVEIN